MLVSWDTPAESHWPALVAPFRGGSHDAEGRDELRASCSPTRRQDQLDPPVPSYTPTPPPLHFSHGGNAGRRLWIIGYFNALKAIIQSKTFQIYFASSVQLSCLLQALGLVLETSCPASAQPIHSAALRFVSCLFSCSLPSSDWVADANAVPGSRFIMWQWCHSVVWQAWAVWSTVCPRRDNGELFCAVFPSDKDSSIIFVLSEVCPAPKWASWYWFDWTKRRSGLLFHVESRALIS